MRGPPRHQQTPASQKALPHPLYGTGALRRLSFCLRSSAHRTLAASQNRFPSPYESTLPKSSLARTFFRSTIFEYLEVLSFFRSSTIVVTFTAIPGHSRLPRYYDCLPVLTAFCHRVNQEALRTQPPREPAKSGHRFAYATRLASKHKTRRRSLGRLQLFN